VKAARDVDGSVLPKNDTARVDQVEVGPFDRDWIAPFIDDRLPPRRAFLGCRPEHPKARKQVAADLLAEAGGDRVVRSGERSRAAVPRLPSIVICCAQAAPGTRYPKSASKRRPASGRRAAGIISA